MLLHVHYIAILHAMSPSEALCVPARPLSLRLHSTAYSASFDMRRSGIWFWTRCKDVSMSYFSTCLYCSKISALHSFSFRSIQLSSARLCLSIPSFRLTNKPIFFLHLSHVLFTTSPLPRAHITSFNLHFFACIFISINIFFFRRNWIVSGVSICPWREICQRQRTTVELNQANWKSRRESMNLIMMANSLAFSVSHSVMIVNVGVHVDASQLL